MLFRYTRVSAEERERNGIMHKMGAQRHITPDLTGSAEGANPGTRRPVDEALGVLADHDVVGERIGIAP